MRRSSILLVSAAAIATASCVAGVVRPDGEIRGAALGKAKLEVCTAGEWPGFPYPNPEPRCTRIEGGAISVGGSEVLGGLIAGAAAYFTGGALP